MKIYKKTVNKKDTKEYKAWRGMMERCYNKKRKMKAPEYDGCVVCDEWHDFQEFAKWYDINYYKIDNRRMCLDKDILVKNNKEYSPKTCMIVPDSINILFTNCRNKRGLFPIGVHFKKEMKKFNSQCRNQISGKMMHLGYYDNYSEAFQKYKEYKEGHIKEVAEYYKDKIPKKLYEAMYSYEIEIND